MPRVDLIDASADRAQDIISEIVTLSHDVAATQAAATWPPLLQLHEEAFERRLLELGYRLAQVFRDLRRDDEHEPFPLEGL